MCVTSQIFQATLNAAEPKKNRSQMSGPRQVCIPFQEPGATIIHDTYPSAQALAASIESKKQSQSASILLLVPMASSYWRGQSRVVKVQKMSKAFKS